MYTVSSTCYDDDELPAKVACILYDRKGVRTMEKERVWLSEGTREGGKGVREWRLANYNLTTEHCGGVDSYSSKHRMNKIRGEYTTI